MRHVWIRIITSAIFLMAQMAGASIPGTSCVERESVSTCRHACCVNATCECGMAPAKTPAKPAPVAPSPRTQEIKFMPLLVSVTAKPFCPLVSQEPIRLLAAEAFLPHCPPALTLHCALLI